jgi:hypothetical protein
MTDDDDAIPLAGWHRQVGLHNEQDEERLTLVRDEIDKVYLIHNPQELLEVASNYLWAPESRLFAAARLRAIHRLNAETRVERAGIDLKLLAAHVAGLNSVVWRSPVHYCSAFDTWAPGSQEPPRRPVPLWRWKK